jgi:hypothetical protein
VANISLTYKTGLLILHHIKSSFIKKSKEVYIKNYTSPHKKEVLIKLKLQGSPDL